MQLPSGGVISVQEQRPLGRSREPTLKEGSVQAERDPRRPFSFAAGIPTELPDRSEVLIGFISCYSIWKANKQANSNTKHVDY